MVKGKGNGKRDKRKNEARQEQIGSAEKKSAKKGD